MSNFENTNAKIYKAGKKFDFMLHLSFILNECAVLVFYFIYRRVYNSTGIFLMSIFLILAVLVGKLTFYFGYKLKNLMCYEITNDALIYSKGQSAKKFLWSSFQEADVKNFNAFDYYPVFFIVDGQKLELNQYIENLPDLGREILKHIQPHAKISERFKNLTQVFS